MTTHKIFKIFSCSVTVSLMMGVCFAEVNFYKTSSSKQGLSESYDVQTDDQPTSQVKNTLSKDSHDQFLQRYQISNS